MTEEKELYFIPQEISLIDKTPQSTTFTETFIFEPTLEEKSLGSLYVVGQVYSTLKRKDNAELLSSLVEIIKNEYYRSFKTEPFRAFKLALKRSNLFLASNRGLFLKSALKINMSVVALVGDNVYATRLTEGVVFIIRGKKINQIESDRKYSTTKKGISFEDIYHSDILAGDTVALTTPQIYKAGKAKLNQILVSPSTFLAKEKDSFKNIGLITAKVVARPQNSTRLRKQEEGIKKEKLRDKEVSSLQKQILKIRKLRIFFFFSLVVLVVGVVTVFAISLVRMSSEKEGRANDIILSIGSLKEKTKTLLELENYSEAEVALTEWRDRLEELKALEVLNSKTKQEEEDLEEYSALVLRYEKVSGVQEIINLSNNSIGFHPEGFIRNKDGFVLFSKDTLYNFNSNTQTGSFSVLPGLTSNGKEIFNLSHDIYLNPKNPEEILILTANSILSYKNDRLNLIIEDERLTNSVRINVFNDAIYVLSTSNIWKIDLESQILTNWLESGLSLDGARDFTIDGFIYVLDKSGVSKFLSGRKNSDISAIKDVTKLTTGVGLKNIYFLDSQRGVLTIADKFGNVSRRITNEKLVGVSSIVIDNNEKTLYFLQSERVFSLSF